MQKGTPRRTILRAGTGAAVAVVLGNQAMGGHAQTTTQTTLTTGTMKEHARMGSQSDQGIKTLWSSWVELWNGDFAIAAEIVAPDFVAHFPPTGSTPVDLIGPEGLTAGIQQFAGAFSEYTFTTTVGPIADDDILAGRWTCRGVYNGGIPGSAPEAASSEVVFEGADVIRVQDGMLVEYWLSADTMSFLQQIGVIPT